MVTELPYQVNKARLIERIADLVREKQIEGIANDGLRDESDKDGMRIVIELRRGENAEVVLNNLYAQTPLETVFGINMVALVDGQPRLLSLKEMLEAFLRHRREVVTRRTVFDLAKARELHFRMLGLHRQLFCEANPIPVKWACAQLGLTEAGIRLPLTPLSKECHERVLGAMRQAGLAV